MFSGCEEGGEKALFGHLFELDVLMLVFGIE